MQAHSLQLLLPRVLGQGNETYLNKLCGAPGFYPGNYTVNYTYVNDLSEHLVECNMNLYADDTALYTGANSYIELMLT